MGGIQSFPDTIYRILSFVGLLNIFLLVISIFFTLGFTGDLVLEGQIIPGESFEGEFILNNIEDLTFIFDTTSSGYSETELLSIVITYPNGSISPLVKIFRNSNTGDAVRTIDFDMVLTPQSTGKYHIKITNAEFPTNLHIKSGMINPMKNISVLVVALISLTIVLISIKRPLKEPSKEVVFIALLISLVTVFATIYYSSM